MARLFPRAAAGSSKKQFRPGRRARLSWFSSLAAGGDRARDRLGNPCAFDLSRRSRHPAQKPVVTFILVWLEVEIAGDLAHALIADPFHVRPHEPVVDVPGNSRSTHGRLLGSRRDLVRMEIAQAEVIHQGLFHRQRLPMIGFSPQAEAGALMEYGVSLLDLYFRSAALIDKILKGTPPGTLPIERAVKFKLIVNLQTAKTLGLTVPPTLLTRADEVIE